MSQIPLRVAIVTSIHLDFDARIWKHARSLAEGGLAQVAGESSAAEPPR